MTLGEKYSLCLMEGKPGGVCGSRGTKQRLLNGGTEGMKVKQKPWTRLKSSISASVACIYQLSSAPKWSTASNNSDIN